MFRIIGPILSICIALAIFVFFVRPLFGEIQVIQNETAGYKEAVASAQKFNALLDSLAARKNSISANERERLNAFVGSNIDEVQALVDLEALAESHGLVFESIAVQLDADKEAALGTESEAVDGEDAMVGLEDLATRELSFTVLGSYTQFKAFLADIERSLVLMEVMKIDFSVTEGELIAFTMTVRLSGQGLRSASIE